MKDPTFELRRNELLIVKPEKKNSGLNGTRPMTSGNRCSALPTELSSHLGAGRIVWVRSWTKWNIWTTPPPPPPISMMPKWRVFSTLRLHHCLEGGRRGLVVPFYSVQDCIWELVTLWVRNIPVDGEFPLVWNGCHDREIVLLLVVDSSWQKNVYGSSICFQFLWNGLKEL